MAHGADINKHLVLKTQLRRQIGAGIDWVHLSHSLQLSSCAWRLEKPRPDHICTGRLRECQCMPAHRQNAHQHGSTWIVVSTIFSILYHDYPRPNSV